MIFERKGHELTIAERYFSIPEDHAWDRYHFFENHRRDLSHLVDHVRMRVEEAHARVLFDLGRYDQFLRRVDVEIERSIAQDPNKPPSHRTYLDWLNQKAEALHHTLADEQALDVTKQILRIDPYNRRAQRQLLKTILCKRSTANHRVKAFCMLLLLTAAAVICVELLVVRPFLPGWTEEIEYLRNGLLLLAVVMLCLNYALSQIRGRRRYRHICRASFMHFWDKKLQKSAIDLQGW